MDEDQVRRIEEVRIQLAKLASSKRTRSSEFSSTRPCRWSPWSVMDPKSGAYFTDDSAWECIADLLKSGHPLEEIILDKPPNKKGYVMKVAGPPGHNDLYIKLQLLAGTVHGRSFHESDYPPERRSP